MLRRNGAGQETMESVRKREGEGKRPLKVHFSVDDLNRSLKRGSLQDSALNGLTIGSAVFSLKYITRKTRRPCQSDIGHNRPPYLALHAVLVVRPNQLSYSTNAANVHTSCKLRFDGLELAACVVEFFLTPR